jgi:hypothetical protein
MAAPLFWARIAAKVAWCAGLAARFREYKKLAIHGGRRNFDSLRESFATDFVRACEDDWNAFDTPGDPPAWQVPWRQFVMRVLIILSFAAGALFLPDLVGDELYGAQLRVALIVAAVFALTSSLEKSMERGHDAVRTAFADKSQGNEGGT